MRSLSPVNVRGLERGRDRRLRYSPVHSLSPVSVRGQKRGEDRRLRYSSVRSLSPVSLRGLENGGDHRPYPSALGQFQMDKGIEPRQKIESKVSCARLLQDP